MNATRAMGQTEPEASSLPKAGSRASGRPRRGQRHPDDDLVVERGVGYPHLERLVMGADRVVVLVLEREVDRGSGRAALLRRRKEGAAVDGIPDEVPEAQVVDDGRPVLDLTPEADERALSVAFDVGGAESAERALGQQPAERLAVGVRQSREILDEASRERVRDHRPGRRDERRWLDRPARLGRTSSTITHSFRRPSIQPRIETFPRAFDKPCTPVRNSAALCQS